MKAIECTCGHCGHRFEGVPEPKHRLLCGDSTKAADVDRLMDGRLADMVWTDPPYGVAIASRVGMGAGVSSSQARAEP